MALDPAVLATADPTGQHAEVLALPDHLRDALWRVEAAGLEPRQSAGLVVAGMGGSAIGGRLAAAVLGARAEKPIVLVSGYELPRWVDESWSVLLSSYSGSTEETLACWEAAGQAGAHRVAATTGGPLAERAMEAGAPIIPIPGGFQPRAAVGYATVIALEVAAACGVGPSVRDEVEATAAGLERPPDPTGLVDAIGSGLPLVIGAELTAPVAYRWKTQINENANRAAFWGELPEHDHNEIEAWAPPLVPVFLIDPAGHERVLKRFDVTARVAREAGVAPVVVKQGGESRAERLFRLVWLGDLLSIHMAVRDGTDPVAIPAIDALKSQL